MQTLNFGGQTMANFSILSVFKPAGRVLANLRVLKGVIFDNPLIYTIVRYDFTEIRKIAI